MSAENLSLFDEPRPRAVFSACEDHPDCELDCFGRKYRYELEWPTGSGAGMVLFVLANPSTATHLRPDPTVARCIDYARSWGYGWCGVANVRAWRETKPKLVPEDPRAIGPENDSHIGMMATRAALIVCGWGNLGGERGREVLRIIRSFGKEPRALAINKDGSPQHPLYLAASLKPFPMRAP